MTWAAGQSEAVRICPIPFAQVALDERWEKMVSRFGKTRTLSVAVRLLDFHIQGFIPSLSHLAAATRQFGLRTADDDQGKSHEKGGVACVAQHRH